MKFKVLNDFKHGFNLFKKDNNHDSDECEEMNNEVVHAYHRAGFIELEGENNNVLNPSNSEVIADNVSHTEVTTNG